MQTEEAVEKHSLKSVARQSNLELLRILAMALIVAGHFCAHSGYDFPAEQYSFNRLWVEFFAIGGNISVNIFVLLSGYFRIEARGLHTAKLIRLWLQLFFYSLVIYFVFVLTGKAPLSFGEIIRRALPVSFRQWWFASCFFVMTLFVPYLNRLLKSLNRKQYLGLLLLTGFCWSLLPTLTGQLFESNQLLWFMFLYSLAGYLRLYGLKTRLTGGKLIALSALCAAAAFASTVLLGMLGMKYPYLLEKRFYFYEIYRLPLLAVSLLLFAGFLRIQVRPNRLINTVASAMFGVYLIHDHPYVRYFLWLDLFHNMDHIADPLLFFLFLGEVSVILAACTVIELLRIHLLERKYLPAVQRLAGALDKRLEQKGLTSGL